MPRPYDFVLELEDSQRIPLFVRISQAIARDIARGRLKAGSRLPGSRTLAETLGVHRSTVVSAYAELLAQGWIVTRPGGATRIAAFPPHGAQRSSSRTGAASRTGFPLEAWPLRSALLPDMPQGTLALWGGVPDVRLVPVELLARAYRRAVKQNGQSLLGYTREARGHVRLREAVAGLVASSRGIAADQDSVMITRGSQMALDLVARSLVKPGDVVAIEALCYASAVHVFRRAGAKLVAIPVDGDGIDVAALVQLTRSTRVRLVYVTPHHQYPTTVILAATRRLQLLELARREKMAIVEDDYDQEFHYDGHPVLPLASSDPHGNVIYLGTLAKILAPGLRLGFVVAPVPLIARMAEERALIDRQGDAVLEFAVAELIEDGDVQRHVRRTRRIYHRRRDALCDVVDQELSGVVSYERPAGGLALWGAVSPGIDLDAWQARSLSRGVYFQIGRQFTLEGSPVPALRLGFAVQEEQKLGMAVRRMVASLPGRGSAKR